MTASQHSRRGTATIVGLVALLFWASLATLTVISGQVPPFELTGITFAIGGCLGLIVAFGRGRGRMIWPSWPVLCLGVAGLFGDYILYFGALRLAPPSQAALIVALWPVMMVALASVVSREALSLRHTVGVLLGLAGMLVLMTNAETVFFVDLRHVPGTLLALGAAVVWAGYSVASRRHAEVPTETVTSFCLVSALLAGLGHLAWERTVLPSDPQQVLALFALGAGPVGASFFAWDFGVKHGDIRVLGILSNAVPVLSTLLLVSAGFATPTPRLGIACMLIVAAAATGTMDLEWVGAWLARRLGMSEQASA